jgi:hypothetical protein
VKLWAEEFPSPRLRPARVGAGTLRGRNGDAIGPDVLIAALREYAAGETAPDNRLASGVDQRHAAGWPGGCRRAKGYTVQRVMCVLPPLLGMHSLSAIARSCGPMGRFVEQGCAERS